MHELSIIASLFEILLEKAGEQQALKITRVKLNVGRLSGVVPEALETAFEFYKKGTIAETAELEIEELPLKVMCQSCRWEALLDGYIFVCPSCNSTNLKILQGTELLLEKIELEIK
jgi:hydrogenase nickel incorporation protein HypA/HybF